MPRKSDGDSKKLVFQVDRFFQQNGGWYYMTREGEEQGPFDSKADAEGELIDYIREHRKKEQFGGHS